jgi:predicted component of type VI protein secretion system
MPRKKTSYSLPSTITVGGMQFKIVLKDMDDFGEMDFDKKIINIRKGLTQEEELDTLIHEVHHVALGISGLSNIMDDENTEEALVRIVDYLVMPIVKQEYKRFIQGK